MNTAYSASMQGTGDTPLSANARSLGNVETVYIEHHPLLAPEGGQQLVASVLLCLIGVWAILLLPSPFPRPSILILAAFALGIVGIVRSLTHIYPGLRRIRRRVFRLEDGLVLVTECGEFVYPWEDIVDVSQKTIQHRFHTEHQYTVFFKDGQEFYLSNNYRQYKELGEVIQTRFQYSLYSRTLAGLKAGKKVRFSRVTLTPDALILDDKKTLSYANIKQVEMKQNGFYLYESGKMLATTFIAWTEVPAAPVLAQLLNTMIRERRSP